MLDSLPEGWKSEGLCDICRPRQHPTVSKAKLTKSGYPVYGANGQIGFFDHFTHDKKTIAITCRGATCGTVNVVPPMSYITGNAMALDDLQADRVNFTFLEQSLRFFGVEQSITGSAQPQITRASLKSVLLPLPPLPEQERIAEILTSVDASIRATEAVIEQAERVKRGLMEDLLTGGLGSEAIARGEVPEGWSTHEFGEVFKVQNDKSKQIQKSSYDETGAYPIIDQGADFIAGYSDGEPNTNFPVVIFGDHTRCVKWVDFPFFAGADGTQALYTSNYAVPKFGYYLMQHVELPNLGYSRHMRELKRKTFLVPNIEEQAKTVELIDGIQAQIDLNRATMNQFQRLKRGLMDDLLTGRVRTVS